MEKIKKSIIKLLDGVILFLEKERLNLFWIFIFVFCISLSRSWVEAWSLGLHHSVITNAHTVSFYFCVFTGGILILKFVTREKLLKIANLVCWGFLILPIAPILDRFVFLRTTGYDYMPTNFFLDVFLTCRGPSEYTGSGQMLILWSIVASTTIYVCIKTRSYAKAAVSFCSFYFFIVIITLPTLNPLIFKANFTHPQTTFLIYYIILTGIFIVLVLKISKKVLLSSLFRSLRPLPTLYFIVMVLLGIIIAGNVDTKEIFVFPFTETFGFIIISVLTMIFLWWFTVVINHAYDIEIDRVTEEDRVLAKGLLTINQGKQIAVLFGMLSAMLAVILGFVLIPVFIAISLAIIYSVPPFRIRNSIFSTAFIGMGSTLAFFIGCLTFPPPIYKLSYFIPTITLPVLQLPSHCLLIGIIIFITLTTGSVIIGAHN